MWFYVVLSNIVVINDLLAVTIMRRTKAIRTIDKVTQRKVLVSK